MKQIFDRIPNDKILHILPFCLNAQIVIRSQILRDASNELWNTNKTPIDSEQYISRQG